MKKKKNRITDTRKKKKHQIKKHNKYRDNKNITKTEIKPSLEE